MKKIIIFLIIYFIFFNNIIYAKYQVCYELNCFEITLKKDFEPPKFEISYSTKAWTNQNVIVTVKPSEEVQEIEGFSLKNGVYQKIVESNETDEIKVLDLAGNEGSFKYEVNNIDKVPPNIIGIENNEKYNEIKYVDYVDNESGIEKVEKTYYGDLLIDSNSDYYNTSRKLGIDINKNSITLKVIRTPKNIVNIRYYRIDSDVENYIISNNRKFKFNNINKNSCKYYALATDVNGNTYKSNIIEKSGCYFEDLKVNKNTDGANISIVGLENIVDKIQYNIISLENNISKVDFVTDNFFSFNKNEFNNSNKYKITLDFKSKDKVLDSRNMYINLNENYIKETNNVLVHNGNYDITVKDNAGNITNYTINLEID